MQQKEVKLKFGVVWGSKTHTDAIVRLATVADNLDAYDAVGSTTNARINFYLSCATIVSLGDIPKENLTYDFLAGEMLPEDWDILAGAQEELKKKRLAESSNESGTTKP